jgi:UDP-3-O-[3-hydroxymyristoyl] glucosamine N-acyltransferase
MPYTIQQIAQQVGGTLHGSGILWIQDALPLQDAGPNHLTLVDSEKNAERFAASPAAVAMAPHDLAGCLHQKTGKVVIGVDDLHQAFIAAIQRLRPPFAALPLEIDPRAVIHPTATLGSHLSIGPLATVGARCVIGDHTRLHPGVHIMDGCQVAAGSELFPGVVLYPGTVVGQRAVIHANAVIGAYGFGYRLENSQHRRTAQLGWVEIGDDVEIGAGTTIDRGTYGPTRIGNGTKLDNQIQIGHNTQLGRHNLICAQVGIAGSCATGDYVVLGGQVGVRDHVQIGDRAMAAAQAGIAGDIPTDEVVLGAPALPQREAVQIIMSSKKLPELRKEVRQLQRMVEELQSASRDHRQPPASTLAPDSSNPGRSSLAELDNTPRPSSSAA